MYAIRSYYATWSLHLEPVKDGERNTNVNVLGYLQKLGKALMLPIATLPVAAILLRIGQPDMLDIPFMAQASYNFV